MSAPVMPLWVDSYLAATTDLTATESGAYLFLLMAAWKNDGPLPNDDKKLARIARLSTGQWARMKDTILSFWDVGDEFITQPRLMKELVAVKRKSQSASDSARSRWLKNKEVGDANALPPQCYPEPKPKPTVPTEPKSKGASAPKFEDFWEKARGMWNEITTPPGNKQEALSAWNKLTRYEKWVAFLVPDEYLLTVVEERKTHPERIAKHICRYLSKRLFMDWKHLCKDVSDDDDENGQSEAKDDRGAPRHDAPHQAELRSEDCAVDEDQGWSIPRAGLDGGGGPQSLGSVVSLFSALRPEVAGEAGEGGHERNGHVRDSLVGSNLFPKPAHRQHER